MDRLSPEALEKRIRELERRSRELKAQHIAALLEAEATFDIFWGVFLSPLWERLQRLEAKAGVSGKSDNEPIDFETVRRNSLIDALRRTGGNKMRAARDMGISVKTLYNWMARYDVRQGGTGGISAG